MPHLRITSVGAALVAISVAAAGGCQLVGGFGDFSGTGGDATGSGGRGDATSAHTSSSSHMSSTHTASSSGAGGEGGSGGCSDATDCNDDDPCTDDTCKQHVCHHEPVADGPTPGFTQVVGDCVIDSCVAGVEKPVPDDTDAPANTDPCTTVTCKNGAKKTVNAADGTSCGPGAAACVGGVCSGCTIGDDATCPAGDECRAYHCKGTGGVGTCKSDDTADDTAIAAQTAGDCHTIVCDGMGGTRSRVEHGDDDDGNPCTTDACSVTGVPTHTNVMADQPCPTGFCDGAGTCVGCTLDVQCGGARVCFDNACCTPDNAVCAAQGKCASAADSGCGQTRPCTINDCGSPSSNFECSPTGTCCNKQTIASVCGSQCGGTKTDACGVSRDCGTNVCQGGGVCIGNACCTPEPSYITCQNECQGMRLNNCGVQVNCDSSMCAPSEIPNQPPYWVCRAATHQCCSSSQQPPISVCNGFCDNRTANGPGGCSQFLCDPGVCTQAGLACVSGHCQ